MVNDSGASVVVIVEAIEASVVVMNVTMANRVWTSVVDWGTMAHRIGASCPLSKEIW